MAVTLTEKAAGEIQRVLTEKNMPAGTVLRVGVAGGGCSGFQYALDFEKDAREGDAIWETDSATASASTLG